MIQFNSRLASMKDGGGETCELRDFLAVAVRF